MNKALLLVLFLFLLSGCGQKDKVAVKESINTYSNENFNVTFQYPSNWIVTDREISKKWVNKKVVDYETIFEHAVILKKKGDYKVYADNPDIYFDYQSENFDEYESKNKEIYKPKEINGEEIGGLSIEEITVANYPAKKYIPYTWEATDIIYIVNKNGRFVKFRTEFYLTEEQKEGIETILNSLEFK